MAQHIPSRFSRSRESSLTPHQRTQSLSNAADLAVFGATPDAVSVPSSGWAAGDTKAASFFDPLSHGQATHQSIPMDYSSAHLLPPANSTPTIPASSSDNAFNPHNAVSGPPNPLGRHVSLPPGTDIPSFLSGSGTGAGRSSGGAAAGTDDGIGKLWGGSPGWSTGMPPLPTYGGSPAIPHTLSPLGAGRTSGGGWAKNNKAGGMNSLAHQQPQQQQPPLSASQQMDFTAGEMPSEDDILGMIGMDATGFGVSPGFATGTNNNSGGGLPPTLSPSALATLAARLMDDKDSLARTSSAPSAALVPGDMAELERLIRSLQETQPPGSQLQAQQQTQQQQQQSGHGTALTPAGGPAAGPPASSGPSSASPLPSPRIRLSHRQLSLAAQLGGNASLASAMLAGDGGSAAGSPDNRGNAIGQDGWAAGAAPQGRGAEAWVTQGYSSGRSPMGLGGGTSGAGGRGGGSSSGMASGGFGLPGVGGGFPPGAGSMQHSSPGVAAGLGASAAAAAAAGVSAGAASAHGALLGGKPASIAAIVRARARLGRTSSCPPLGDEIEGAPSPGGVAGGAAGGAAGDEANARKRQRGGAGGAGGTTLSAGEAAATAGVWSGDSATGLDHGGAFIHPALLPSAMSDGRGTTLHNHASLAAAAAAAVSLAAAASPLGLPSGAGGGAGARGAGGRRSTDLQRAGSVGSAARGASGLRRMEGGSGSGNLAPLPGGPQGARGGRAGGTAAAAVAAAAAASAAAGGAAAEAPKDYIHVRARRGQATDSHSLAERVRREKISERMKVLQGLVPSCSKVTGKAMVLDEIIAYVRTLQLHVQLLSSKLVETGMEASAVAKLLAEARPEEGDEPIGASGGGEAAAGAAKGSAGDSSAAGATGAGGRDAGSPAAAGAGFGSGAGSGAGGEAGGGAGREGPMHAGSGRGRGAGGGGPSSAEGLLAQLMLRQQAAGSPSSSLDSAPQAFGRWGVARQGTPTRSASLSQSAGDAGEEQSSEGRRFSPVAAALPTVEEGEGPGEGAAGGRGGEGGDGGKGGLLLAGSMGGSQGFFQEEKQQQLQGGLQQQVTFNQSSVAAVEEHGLSKMDADMAAELFAALLQEKGEEEILERGEGQEDFLQAFGRDSTTEDRIVLTRLPVSGRRGPTEEEPQAAPRPTCQSKAKP